MRGNSPLFRSWTLLFATSFLALGAAATPVGAQTETLRLGLDPAGWEHLDAPSRNNVMLIPGFRGSRDIVIVPDSYEMGPATDLLLSFDGGAVRAEGPSYTLQQTAGRVTDQIVARGTGALALEGEESGIVLQAQPGAVFAANSVWQDLTIELWLYPSVVTEGEVVLSWEGSRIVPGGTEPQSFYVDVAGQRLRWSFNGLFALPRADGSLEYRELAITGIRRLVPETWQHHLFRYDAESGLMEYLLDGVPEAVRYATPSGREESTTYTAVIGAGGRRLLRVAPNFRGLIDDVRISREFVDWDPSADSPSRRYSGTRGTAELHNVSLGSRGGRILAIDVGTRLPPGGEVWSYYRMQDLSGSPGGEWIPFRSGEELPADARGRFLDLRLELYPDVEADESPRVTDIAVTYEPDQAPAPPQRLFAEAQEGGVRLGWSPTYEEDVEGYLLFYGTRPGSYFGRGARVLTEGPGAESSPAPGGPADSPIDVGMTQEAVISGLEPGRMYFFAVAAYDELGRTRPGVLSSEVSARPEAAAR